MKKFRVLKLKTVCFDRASQLTGTITHMTIRMDGSVGYFFQPQGLDEKGEPRERLFVKAEHLDVTPEAYHEIDVPMNILGTIVTDDLSSFSGMAMAFVWHINGCLHVSVQAPAKDGKVLLPLEFDLRHCSGEEIPKLTEAEVVASEVKKPSPAGERREPPFH